MVPELGGGGQHALASLRALLDLQAARHLAPSRRSVVSHARAHGAGICMTCELRCRRSIFGGSLRFV